MLLAVAALLLQFPVLSPYKIQAAEKVNQPAAVAKAAADSAVSSKSENSASSGKEVLNAETLSPDAEASVAFAPGRVAAKPVAPVSSAPATSAAEPASPVAIEPAPVVPSYGRVYGPPIRAVSDQRQHREWLALSIAAHSAAGFDAWSTRRVISSVPQAQEMNPLLRPFAGNASMYAAVQVAPAILDFLSRRMMNSRYAWARHTWWLPQTVSAVISLSSGVHNLGVYNSR
jgi:hypothetical protein